MSCFMSPKVLRGPQARNFMPPKGHSTLGRAISLHSGRFDVPTLAWCVALALARGRSRWVGLVAPSQCHPVWTGSALAPGGARPDFSLMAGQLEWSTFTDLFPSTPFLRRFSYLSDLSVTSSLSLSRLGTETRSTEVMPQKRDPISLRVLLEASSWPLLLSAGSISRGRVDHTAHENR